MSHTLQLLYNSDWSSRAIKSRMPIKWKYNQDKTHNLSKVLLACYQDSGYHPLAFKQCKARATQQCYPTSQKTFQEAEQIKAKSKPLQSKAITFVII